MHVTVQWHIVWSQKGEPHMGRFSLEKVKNVEGKEHYWVEIAGGFAVLKNLDDNMHINRAWKTVRENIKILAKWILGYYQLKQLKPWFDRGYSELL